MPNINKKDASVYEVESHNKGEFYTVDITVKTCTCPHYQFRLKRFGGECKHIVAVRDFIAANSEIKEYKSKYKRKDMKTKEDSKKKDNPADHNDKTTGDAKKNNEKKDSNDLTLEILKEVESKGEHDIVELFDKYGEFIINDLIAKGYLIELKGKVKLLK